MASRSVNKVILLGHLGKDAETKFTPSGVSVTKMTVATNRRWKDAQTGDWKDETDWHNVTGFKMENYAQYLQKGKQVYVEGRLQTRSYDDKDGKKLYYTEVIVDEIFLCGSGGGRGDSGPQITDEVDPGYSAPSRSSGPVSMPRSAQQRPAPPPQAQHTSSPSSTPFEAEITDDDVPF